VVCKHWLRGLCKKGDNCEFLHEYNLRKMPECWFYSKYGECNNGAECIVSISSLIKEPEAFLSVWEAGRDLVIVNKATLSSLVPSHRSREQDQGLSMVRTWIL
jgi:hypothetical protein